MNPWIVGKSILKTAKYAASPFWLKFHQTKVMETVNLYASEPTILANCLSNHKNLACVMHRLVFSIVNVYTKYTDSICDNMFIYKIICISTAYIHVQNLSDLTNMQ